MARLPLATAAAAALVALLSALPAAATTTSVSPISSPTYTGPVAASSTIGCFATGDPLNDYGPYTFQSTGNCQRICLQVEMPVMGLVNGSNCYCGPMLPPADLQIDMGECDTPCNGYSPANCGGNDHWLILMSGLNHNKVEHISDAELSKSSSSSTGTGTSPASSSSNQKGGGGGSKVGIAVGVVVGIVVVIGIGIGTFVMFMRRSRKEKLAAERAQSDDVKAFVSRNMFQPDSRLNTNTMNRRLSSGSIDYTGDFARPLQVANP